MSWLVALCLLFTFVVAVPLLRMLLSGTIYVYARVTGRHALRATAARVMPKIGHVIGSIVVGFASVAAPAMAANDVATISVDRDGGASALQVPDEQPASEEERTAKLYVVKTGDTLWGIAASELDDPTNAEITETWKAIWRANRTVLGSHPEFIRPGMQLSLEGIDQ